MPYRISKIIEIESGHMLSKHPEKCRFPHGHTRKVEFVLEAEALDENEMVCDFKIVKELMNPFLESLDHALCMNTRDPEFARMKAAYGERVIEFPDEDPTTEVMARTVYREFSRQLERYRKEAPSRFAVRESVRIVSVRIWETSSSWAEYWE